MKPLTARALAVNVLARVEATDAYLDLVLDAQLDEAALEDPRDAGLVTELCYGTTRRRMLLDACILQFADRKLDALEDKVLAALRIGAYQLFFMRLPRHAAVAETVEALKTLGVERAAGFCNAILRKLSALESPQLPPREPLAPYLSLKESHPLPLVERWLRQFGPERTEAMLAADNVAPGLALRTNTTKGTREQLLEELRSAGLEATPTTLSPVGIRMSGVGRVEDLLGFDEGRWSVQDEAAQLVGLYAQVPETARVLDVCAAPGGKALHLAETHEEVWACDLHANKLRKIHAEARRLGLQSRIRMEAHDGTEPFPEAWGEFHAVMVDAPCSGSGTLRRHPELRYRRNDADVLRLATLQRRILESAQAVVAPGGLLVYAVCSVDFREGPDQVELFLRSHPEWTLEPPVLPGLPLPLWQGALRTLPGPEGLDGFYAARLRKMY